MVLTPTFVVWFFLSLAFLLQLSFLWFWYQSVLPVPITSFHSLYALTCYFLQAISSSAKFTLKHHSIGKADWFDLVCSATIGEIHSLKSPPAFTVRVPNHQQHLFLQKVFRDLAQRLSQVFLSREGVLFQLSSSSSTGWLLVFKRCSLLLFCS